MLQRISFRIVYVCQFSLPPICRKVENIKDSLAPRRPSISHTPLQIQTWYPKVRRVFLVSVRERIALSHQHSSPASSDPPFFFSLSLSSTNQILKHVLQRKNKETKKKLWTKREIQYSFSFLSHFSLTLVLIPPYLSWFVYRLRLSDESDCDL